MMVFLLFYPEKGIAPQFLRNRRTEEQECVMDESLSPHFVGMCLSSMMMGTVDGWNERKRPGGLLAT